MRISLIGLLLAGVCLLGCDEPDFTFSECNSYDDNSEADGEKSSSGDPVEVPENGNFSGLFCIGYEAQSSSKAKINVINFWTSCQEQGGTIDKISPNNYEVSIKPVDDQNPFCSCPFDFNFNLGVDSSIDTLTVEVFREDDGYWGFESVFNIVEGDADMRCWESGFE